MVWNGIDPTNNSDIQRYCHLDIPTEYQYLTRVTVLILVGRFLNTIIDVDY
jgi:hypothetical protein